jgi:hypothetical protein
LTVVGFALRVSIINVLKPAAVASSRSAGAGVITAPGLHTVLFGPCYSALCRWLPEAERLFLLWTNPRAGRWQLETQGSLQIPEWSWLPPWLLPRHYEGRCDHGCAEGLLGRFTDPHQPQDRLRVLAASPRRHGARRSALPPACRPARLRNQLLDARWRSKRTCPSGASD